MKHHKLFLFFFINLFLQISYVFSQEKLAPLHRNSNSITRGSNTERSSALYPSKIFFIMDTLSIPFVDDFSSNKFQNYYYPSFPKALTFDTVIYSYEISNCVGLPILALHESTINYSKKKQFDLKWNVGTQKYDSTETQRFNITFYSFYTNNLIPKMYPESPFNADSGFVAWRGGLKDSVTIINLYDTTVYSISIKLDSIKVAHLKNNSNNALWMDSEKSVFINNTYPINQPTIGVATFDGLNSKGMPYDFVTQKNSRADFLTSKPINISNASAKYLSFFWQRQGLGDMPEFTDSLLLQFRTPQTQWTTIWSKFGGVGDTIFEQKTIEIDSTYHNAGFQFRFINRALLSGANDHWHLDYVRLVKDPKDTIIQDLAFVKHPTSFLKEYENVPYNQYNSTLMKTIANNTISNTSIKNIQTDFNYFVSDYYGKNKIDSLRINNFKFNASSINQSESPSAINPLRIVPTVHSKFEFPTMTQCTEYRIKEWLSPYLPQLKSNDTISFIQRFSDYYAYDDGSAEAGYQLTTPAASMAVQCNLINEDKIKGLRIFFDPLNDNYTGLEFKLRVWADTVVTVNGSPFHQPGKLLHETKNTYTVNYVNEDSVSVFAEYLFDTEISLKPGLFYAGIFKDGTTGLNIGFDKNNNNQTRMYFTPSAGVWGNTQFEGSYMMRPIFGLCPNGVPSGVSSPQSELEGLGLRCFPNPTNSNLTVQFDDTNAATIEITDITGRVVYTSQNNYSNTTIDVSNLNDGIYLLKIYSSDYSFYKSAKFSILR